MTNCYILWRYINGAISFKTVNGRPSGNVNKAVRFEDLEEAYRHAQEGAWAGISHWSVDEEGYPLVMRFIAVRPSEAVTH